MYNAMSTVHSIRRPANKFVPGTPAASARLPGRFLALVGVLTKEHPGVSQAVRERPPSVDRAP